MKQLFFPFKRFLFFLLISCIGLPQIGFTANEEPLALFLTWQQDPTTTMTIDWQVSPDQKKDRLLHYRIVQSNSSWMIDTALHVAFPYSDRIIQRVELTGLESGTTYEFRMGSFSKIYRFRTMPKHNYKPIRFVSGGDTNTEKNFQKMNQIAANYDPDFIIWGGDLAYANANKENIGSWYRWFDGIKKDLITKEGRVIPILLAIGNHDVINHHYPFSESTMKKKEMWYDFIKAVKQGQFPEASESWQKENAPFFYGLFAFPSHPGYGVLDFGNYLSLICLDSSHSNLINGRQTDWLKAILAERKGKFAHIVPYYHKQAYPSKRVAPGGTRSQFWSTQILTNWVPLFESAGVRFALEHDDHTYKRTYPILGDKVNPKGIVYIGDGAWGVDPETPKTPEEVWYLEKTQSINHAIVTTLQGPFQHFLVVDNDGNIIDEFPQSPKIH